MVLPLDSLARSPDVAGPLRRKTASQDEQVPVICGVRLVGIGKQTAWSGKGGQRCFLSRTVPPRPPLPNGEAPHRGSSKARSPPGNLSEKDRWQGKRLRVWDSTLGRGEQRSERLTPSHLRGVRRDCSQAVNDSRRESPNEETQSFQPPPTFTTGLSRHQRFDQPQQNQDGQRSEGERRNRVFCGFRPLDRGVMWPTASPHQYDTLAQPFPWPVLYQPPFADRL